MYSTVTLGVVLAALDDWILDADVSATVLSST